MTTVALCKDWMLNIENNELILMAILKDRHMIAVALPPELIDAIKQFDPRVYP